MKILLQSDAYKPSISGVVTSLVNLQQGLTQLGHEVRVLTVSESHSTSYKEGVWYLRSLSSGPIYPDTRVRDTFGRKAVEDLVNWRPDVVHSQSEFSTFPLAKRIAQTVGAPHVHTYHTLYEDYTTYFSPNKKMGKAMAKHFTRHILAKTDVVIAPTTKIERLLKSYKVTKPIRIIPSGIDLSRFAHVAENQVRDALKKSLGISLNHKVIVFVGRLAKEKNLEELITNFSLSKTNMTLLLVGDGPQRKLLEDLVLKLGLQDRVVFAGMQHPQSIASYYHLGDLFCSASTSETQGMTYLEALASGLPVLCHADDCLEDLLEDGVNGYQYHANEEFLRYLDLLNSDSALLERLSSHARASVSKYDRLSFAKSVSELYEQLVSARRGM